MTSGIDKDYLISLMQKLIQTKSVNPFGDKHQLNEKNEMQIAELVEQELKKAGISCDRKEIEPYRPTVTASIGKGKGMTLLLNTHLDTVGTENMTIKPFSGTIKHGRVYGRGATDTKASLAAMIAALIAVSEKEIKGKCIFTAVCDEEHAGIGSRHVASTTRYDAAVIGEPTELGIGIAQPGGMKFRIKTLGKSTHGCTPYAGVNAIEKMVKLIRRLPETIDTYNDLIGYPTLNIGQINGGTDPSIVPDMCRITCDRRLLPDEDANNVLGRIEALIQAMTNEDSQFKAELEKPFLGPVSGFELSKDEPIVRVLSSSYKSVTGNEAAIIGTPYGADGMYLYQKGTPSITFGPGNIVDAHTKDESIDIESVIMASKIYALTIMEFCR